MRISIWQQFSSNHSANFTVVGRFETPAKAAEAATKLREILQAVIDFDAGSHNFELTWPEQEYAKQYEVEWAEHLDWLYSPLEQHVVLLDNYLIVSNLNHQPSIGPEPIDGLVLKLGGELKLEGEFLPTVIYVDIQFAAPDEATAKRIFDEMKFYIDRERREAERFVLSPWLLYAKSYKHPEAERLLHLEKASLAHQSAEYEWNKQCQNDLNPLWRELRKLDQQFMGLQAITNKTDLDAEAIQRYRELSLKHRIQREEYMAAYPPLSFEDYSFLADEAGGLDASPLDKGGDIYKSGTHIQITKLSFYQLGLGLPAFIAWLKDQGCTNIQYQFLELSH